MNCTELYQVFSSRSIPASVMPVDFAMSLCLGCSPPIRNFLQSYEDMREVHLSKLKPLRSCLNQKSTTEIPDAKWENDRNVVKKKVVFADSKGLSLTAVRFFSKFEDKLGDFQLSSCDLGSPRPKVKNPKPEEKKFVLDFAQPSTDYVDFRRRLQSDLVCLENCIIQDKIITGTIKVMNVNFEKCVRVRITFDSWKSCRDVDCSYMHNTYGCSEIDTFSFEVSIPEATERQNIEFCICYQCGEKEHWDSNGGRNYRVLCMEKQHPKGAQSPSIEIPNCRSKNRTPETNEERFGSPRSAALVFSHWQSWGRMNSTGVYW